MMKFHYHLPIVLFLFILTSNDSVLGENHPFTPGEKLVYGIKWTGIPVGEGSLEVVSLGKHEGEGAYHFELRVESYPIIDLLYKVRDKFSSRASQDLKRSYHFRKIQNEGRIQRDVEVRFDWDKKLVSYSNFDNEKKPVPLIPGALDPLSAVYFVRSRDLEGSEVLRVPVTDGKKCIVGVANVLGKETIKVDSGLYETYLLEANTEKIGGIFEKTKNTKFKVWITTDGRRIPVKVETKVSIGWVAAELISSLEGSTARP